MEKKDWKYYLMIGQPNDTAWKGILKAEDHMAVLVKKQIEEMGGKLISYYIAALEPKNYSVVAFPSSFDWLVMDYITSGHRNTIES